MTREEIEERMEVCPWRERPQGDLYVCTRYMGTIVLCDGRCSWVVDYPKIKELESKKINYDRRTIQKSRSDT